MVLTMESSCLARVMRFTQMHSKMRNCNFDVQKLESKDGLGPYSHISRRGTGGADFGGRPAAGFEPRHGGTAAYGARSRPRRQACGAADSRLHVNASG